MKHSMRGSQMKVLITEPVHPDGVEFLRSKGVEVTCAFGISREELLQSVAMYDGLIIRSDTAIDRELLDLATHLKVVGMAGIGLNHVDLFLADERGVRVYNVPDGSNESVAELTIGFLIAVARKIVLASSDTKKGMWDKSGYMGHTLQGKTLGILALGRIGTRVAEIARVLGMNILACDPYLDEQEVQRRGAQKVELDSLLRASDFVSIHSPLNEQTYHLIGREQIEMMKDGSFLINLGRGGIVDEEALYDALVSGKLKGAALDVMEVEPAPKSKLFTLDNIFITPHIGAGTVESQQYISLSIATKVFNHLIKNQ